MPNSRLDVNSKELIDTQISKLKVARPLLFFSSSGTTLTKSQIKLIGLSKEALLTSASAVNQTYGYSANEVFYNVLPLFHVGGVGTLIRANLLGASHIDESHLKWNPNHYVNQLDFYRVTTSSVVPTMLFDIAKEKLKAPKTVKTVLVGGGHLNSELKKQILDLGWPIIESYGMTECASQVAADLDGDGLKILPHVDLKINSNGFIQVSSRSLLDGILFIDNGSVNFVDPKVDGSFITADRGQLQNQVLFIEGRADDQVKINGELISLSKVNEAWLNETGLEGLIIIAVDDERAGKRLVLFVESAKYPSVISFKDKIESRLLKLERVSEVRVVEKLPRTELGKIMIGQLK